MRESCVVKPVAITEKHPCIGSNRTAAEATPVDEATAGVGNVNEGGTEVTGVD